MVSALGYENPPFMEHPQDLGNKTMYTLKFDIGNSAFDGDNLPLEIANILVKVSNNMHARFNEKVPVFDSNGNCVGNWIIEKE